MNIQNIDEKWETRFLEYFEKGGQDHDDASHDLSHFRRVAHTAHHIAALESAPIDAEVLLAAAYFHDIVTLPKNHPDNKMSSRYSSAKAKEILAGMDFPPHKIESVCHAIEAHSFSAQLEPETLEAKIVQDADRMESLGALGAMRTFYVSGRLQRSAFDPDDVCAERRPLDDKMFGFDHFYCKLFKLPALLQTSGGRRIAVERTEFLHQFARELIADVRKGEGGALEVVRACYYGGQHGLKLFDSQDPFAVRREPQPDKFVIDRLMQVRDKFPAFIESFLAQLHTEIDL